MTILKDLYDLFFPPHDECETIFKDAERRDQEIGYWPISDKVIIAHYYDDDKHETSTVDLIHRFCLRNAGPKSLKFKREVRVEAPSTYTRRAGSETLEIPAGGAGTWTQRERPCGTAHWNVSEDLATTAVLTQVDIKTGKVLREPREVRSRRFAR